MKQNLQSTLRAALSLLIGFDCQTIRQSEKVDSYWFSRIQRINGNAATSLYKQRKHLSIYIEDFFHREKGVYPVKEEWKEEASV